MADQDRYPSTAASCRTRRYAVMVTGRETRPVAVVDIALYTNRIGSRVMLA
jgi:hypothetical protein